MGIRSSATVAPIPRGEQVSKSAGRGDTLFSNALSAIVVVGLRHQPDCDRTADAELPFSAWSRARD